MQAGRAEQQARGQEPEARGFGAAVEHVGEDAAADHADERGALKIGGGVEGGVALVEQKLVVEEIGQPTVDQPEAEDEDREDDAEQQKAGQLNEGADRQSGPRLGGLHGFFLYRAEEKKIRS